MLSGSRDGIAVMKEVLQEEGEYRWGEEEAGYRVGGSGARGRRIPVGGFTREDRMAVRFFFIILVPEPVGRPGSG